MARSRPTLVLVFGVLNIVFGSLGFLLMLCSGGAQIALDLMPRSGGAAKSNVFKETIELSDQMRQEIPGYAIASIAGLVLLLILAVTLVVAGIGLLKMKPWARATTLVWSAVLIIYEVVSTTYQVVLVNPVQLRLQQQVMARQAAGMAKFPLFGSTFTAIIAIVMGLLVIAYAGALIAVLRIPSIRAAFAGKSLASADERPDYYDDRSKESRSAND